MGNILERFASSSGLISSPTFNCTLLQKSHQYSTDPVVRFGFCRGLEPVNYVTFILERYNHYKQFVTG